MRMRVIILLERGSYLQPIPSLSSLSLVSLPSLSRLSLLAGRVCGGCGELKDDAE